MISAVITLLILNAALGRLPTEEFYKKNKCVFCGRGDNLRIDVSDDIDAGAWQDKNITLHSGLHTFTKRHEEYMERGKTYYMRFEGINDALTNVDKLEIYIGEEHNFKPLWFFVHLRKSSSLYLFTCKGNCNIKKYKKFSNPLTVCKDGYSTKNAKCVKCKRGKWGYECDQTCYCQDQSRCDISNGECGSDNCPMERQGPSCLTECKTGTWGPGCSNQCHCKDNAKCNATTGKCPDGCKEGYYGDPCWDICMYGDYCYKLCTCLDGAICDNMTGACPSNLCDARHHGENCLEGCEDGKYGLNCSETCRCAYPEFCNVTNGICEEGGCAKGYYGEAVSCQNKCQPGVEACDKVCRCKDESDCDVGFARCPSGCDPRFSGKDCLFTCPYDRFSLENCSGQCHCENPQSCDVITGACDKLGCVLGYTGFGCQIKTFAMTPEVTIGITMTIFTIIILGILIYVMYATVWKKFRKSREERAAMKIKAEYMNMGTHDLKKDLQDAHDEKGESSDKEKSK